MRRLLRSWRVLAAVALPVAMMCQTSQATASTGSLRIEIRSDGTQNVAYAFTPGDVVTDLTATIDGVVNGTTIDPSTCDATVAPATSAGHAGATLSNCGGTSLGVQADAGADGTGKITVFSEGRPIAAGTGTVGVTVEHDPDNPAIIIVIILIIIFLLIPLAAH